MKLKIAMEAVLDPYGGLYSYVQKLQQYSCHTISEIPSRGLRFFTNRSSFLRNLYRQKFSIRGFNVLHSMADPWFINICQRSKNKTNKWVQTVHAWFYPEDYPDGLQLWQIEQNQAVLFAAQHADKVISVSEWGAKQLLEKYNIPSVVIPNGADFNLIKKIDTRVSQQFLGVKDFILFVGSFREVKSPDLFIRLAQRLADKTFVMLGDGIDRQTLMDKYQLTIPANLLLLGRTNHRMTLNLLAACRVYVMTSKNEGLPNSLLEAMSFGKTVVVPNHTGCKELIPSEEFGFLYETNNLEELVAKTKQAFEDRDRGLKAKTRAQENYNIENIILKFDKFYSSLV